MFGEQPLRTELRVETAVHRVACHQAGDAWATRITGLAWINCDGEHRLFQRPLPAENVRRTQGIRRRSRRCRQSHDRTPRTHALADARDRHINRNNHPFAATNVVGTITARSTTPTSCSNAFERYAQVDSEVVFRIANAVTRRGRIDVRRMLRSSAIVADRSLSWHLDASHRQR